MAPAARVEIEETAPATLPEDFAEWDSGGPPATLPDDFTDFDDVPATVAAPSPPDQSANAKASASQVVSGLPGRSRMIVTAPAQAQELFDSFPPDRANAGGSVEEEETVKPRNKRKTVMFAALGAIPVLALLILIPLKYYKSSPEPAVVIQSDNAQQPATTTVTIPEPPLEKPSPTTPEPAVAKTTVAEDPAPVRSEMMRDQLNAPTRISREIKTAGKEAPPASGFGGSGMEGLGTSGSGAIGSVFDKQNHLKVQGATSKTVNLSAGVAQGMLIQKTSPIYPPIAKSARVSGTVVLQATISKTGSIQGLRAVSGPEMLRQSALDAVRTWRYKPYTLNNEPVEVDTTVKVIFNLGG
jgi:protein TonB